ncbi:MAG: cytochrome P450 [Polyangiales bacterium]
METTTSSPTTSARRAPRVPGGVPFFGHAIAFGRDPDAYLASCRERHGDVFELRFPDGWRTFLLEPRDYQTVLSHKALRLDDFAVEFGVKVFGYGREAADELGNHEMSRMVLRHLSGDALEAASLHMQRLLRERIAREVDTRPREVALLSFVTRQVFAAGTDAVFGDGTFDEGLYEAYQRIDRALPALYLGIPSVLLPRVSKAQKTALRTLSVLRPDPSPLVAERRALYAAHHVGVEESGRMDTSLLWAAQANTVATAFWVVFHVLRDERAREAVRGELEAVIADVGDGPFDRHALKRMVALDSTIDEVFRVASSAFIPRRASEPIVLPLVSGPLAVEKGETLNLYPRAMQMDPEIFDSPEEFRFDRFLTKDGSPARFEKRGQKLAFPLLPFGAGPSMCPGRHFARNEMKLVVATLLAGYELELLDRQVPAFDLNRIGFGTTPPARDVRVRLRKRG